eukprot:4157975-Pleurochrysis_carterae.AAC.3
MGPLRSPSPDRCADTAYHSAQRSACHSAPRAGAPKAGAVCGVALESQHRPRRRFHCHVTVQPDGRVQQRERETCPAPRGRVAHDLIIGICDVEAGSSDVSRNCQIGGLRDLGNLLAKITRWRSNEVYLKHTHEAPAKTSGS